MPLIEPGKKAPSFTLKDQNGKTHKLSDYEGRPVVLYFYPKDRTSGCTIEAHGFRVGYPQFKELGVEVTAIRRHGIRGVEPDPSTKLREADIVVRDVAEARSLSEMAERFVDAVAACFADIRPAAPPPLAEPSWAGWAAVGRTETVQITIGAHQIEPEAVALRRLGQG